MAKSTIEEGYTEVVEEPFEGYTEVEPEPAKRSIYDGITDPNKARVLAEEVTGLSRKFGLPTGVVEGDFPFLSSFPDPQDFGTSVTKMTVPPPRTHTIDGQEYVFGPQSQQKQPIWNEMVDGVASMSAQMAASFAEPMGRVLEADRPNVGMMYETPATIIERKQLALKWKETSDFLWKLSKDPSLAAKNTDAASKALRMLAETLPYITATSLATLVAGPAGGFFVGWQVEGHSAYRTALEHGESEDKARLIGLCVGMISGAIETFGGSRVTAMMKKKAIARATKSVTGKLKLGVALFGLNTVNEVGEEASQEIAALLGEATYRPDIGWEEALSRTLGSAAGGALLGGVFGLGRAAVKGGFTTDAERQAYSEAKEERARMAGLRQDIKRINSIKDMSPDEKQEWIKARIAKEGLQMVEEEKAEGEGEKKPAETQPTAEQGGVKNRSTGEIMDLKAGDPYVEGMAINVIALPST